MAEARDAKIASRTGAFQPAACVLAINSEQVMEKIKKPWMKHKPVIAAKNT